MGTALNSQSAMTCQVQAMQTKQVEVFHVSLKPARGCPCHTRAYLQPCTYVSQSTIILMLGSPSCIVLPFTPMLSPCCTSPGCLCVICCHFQLESAAPFLRDLYGGHDNSQESVLLQDSLGFDQITFSWEMATSMGTELWLTHSQSWISVKVFDLGSL